MLVGTCKLNHVPTSHTTTTDPQPLIPAAPGNNVQVPRRTLNYNIITISCLEHFRDQTPFDDNSSAVPTDTATPLLTPTTVTQNPNQDERTCKCSYCYQLGHQRRTCPNLPCVNCNLMGHLSRYCPDLAEERARWRNEATKRYNQKLKAKRKGE